MTGKPWILLAASLMFTAACAQATGKPSCVGSVGVHGTLRDPADLGHGIVSQGAVEANSLSVSEVVRYTDCASGKTLMVEVKQSANDPIVEEFDDSAAVGAFQKKIATMPRPVDLDAMGALATRMGLRTKTLNLEFETCACRLFHPELRGDKKPFDLNSVY